MATVQKSKKPYYGLRFTENVKLNVQVPATMHASPHTYRKSEYTTERLMTFIECNTWLSY